VRWNEFWLLGFGFCSVMLLIVRLCCFILFPKDERPVPLMSSTAQLQVGGSAGVMSGSEIVITLHNYPKENICSAEKVFVFRVYRHCLTVISGSRVTGRINCGEILYFSYRQPNLTVYLPLDPKPEIVHYVLFIFVMPYHSIVVQK